MCKLNGWVDAGQVELSLIICMMMMRFDRPKNVLVLVFSPDLTLHIPTTPSGGHVLQHHLSTIVNHRLTIPDTQDALNHNHNQHRA